MNCSPDDVKDYNKSNDSVFMLFGKMMSNRNNGAILTNETENDDDTSSIDTPRIINSSVNTLDSEPQSEKSSGDSAASTSITAMIIGGSVVACGFIYRFCISHDIQAKFRHNSNGTAIMVGY